MAKSVTKSGADIRRPRVVLTDQAIFHKDVIHPSVPGFEGMQDDSHHRLTIGDTVLLTDAEFERHRDGGVSLVDAGSYVEAAE